VGGDGAEVDWFIGYRPPPETFLASLERILKGEGTYKSLLAAYTANPKDVAAAFGLARKWSDRFDTVRSEAKFKEVVAVDPDGKAGTFTDPDTFVTAPYADFARYALATSSFMGNKPDPAPVKAFIAAYSASPLIKQAYRELSYMHARGPKDEAQAFFAEYGARFPNDPEALSAWLRRIIMDKGPLDKGAELAGKLREISISEPNPDINQLLAQLYDLQGDKVKADEVYGKGYMDNQVQRLANDLIAYSNYWVGKKVNVDNAEAMADLVLKLQPGDSYVLRSVANIYVRAGEDGKALEIYGPAWIEKGGAAITDTDLYSYAAFWARLGKNLESALAAAKKSVEVQPRAYYYWSTLSDVYNAMGDKTQAVRSAETAVSAAEGQAKQAMQRKLDALLKPAPEKK
jgi:tetratricopeptide (TPR) repeat protein